MSDEDVRKAIRMLDREAAPPAAAVALLEREARKRPRRRLALLAAAAAIVLVVAVVIGRHARSADPFPSPFMDEIALDHLHYVDHPSPAQFSGPRAELSAWFSPTLGHPMRLEPLEATDYIGGRNCWLRGKYAALVLAERAHHRLSLFEIPDVPPRARSCGSAQGVRICAMPDPDGGARVLVGDLPDAELLRLLEESI